MTIETRDRLNQVICVLAVVVAVLGCLPFAEAGFNDDWIYSHMALSLARTGHFVYESATNATILVQTYLGSFLIHLFGFSFKLLRFSTLPFAIGCGVLTYKVARATGLNSTMSLFASLGFVTSPLFIPLAASFMSDVDTCFFMLLSLYFGVLAAEEGSDRKRLLWLLASVLVGYVGGLERQTAYFAPGTVLLWAMWRWRLERRLMIPTVCMFLALGGASYLAVRWQTSLPLSPDDVRPLEPSWWKTATYPGRFILTLTLLILPAAILTGKGFFRISPRWYVVSSACVLAGFLLFWRIAHLILFPWEPDMLTSYGILAAGVEMRGQKALVLNHSMRIVVSLAVLIAITEIGAVLLNWMETRGVFRNGPFAWARTIWQAFYEATVATQMLVVFGAFNAAFLLIRSRDFTFDRYLLPLIPIAIILSLLTVQKGTNSKLGTTNWFLLILFAAVGVAITHDYFAALEARVKAFQKIEALGVPARNITGGLELDGWTQSEITSHMQSTPPRKKLDPIYARYWSAVYMPDVDPLYYLSWSDEPGLKSAPIGGVWYQNWLPPVKREIKILVPDR